MYAGQTDDGLSSQVASILDQEVKGPTEAAWSDGEGKTWVTSVAGVDRDGDYIPTYPCDGSWRTFAPTTGEKGETRAKRPALRRR